MTKLASIGYKITNICNAFEVPRSSYYYHQGKVKRGYIREKRKKLEEEILCEIRDIKKIHPLYGYRRTTALVKKKLKKYVNHKRIYRLMKEEKLLCERKKYKAKRHKPGDRSKPKAKYPNHWWGTDMTKHYIEGYGWLYIVPVLDWYTKEVVGIEISGSCKTEIWKSALENGVLFACHEGSREYSINLMSDNGSQPTSGKYEKTCKRLGINHVTTSYNNPKGNAETESFIKTLKEDCLWINEFDSFEDAKREILSWIDYYNHEYPHSAIGYKSPRDMRLEFDMNLKTLNQKPEKCV